MKFFDFRKYFFSYLYIIFCFVFYFLYWTYVQANYPPPKENEIISDGTFHFIAVGYFFTFYLCSTGLLVLEMLLRKFVVEKYFPNLKFPIKISLPRKLNLFLSVVFYILFSLATVPIIIVLFFI